MADSLERPSKRQRSVEGREALRSPPRDTGGDCWRSRAGLSSSTRTWEDVGRTEIRLTSLSTHVREVGIMEHSSDPDVQPGDIPASGSSALRLSAQSERNSPTGAATAAPPPRPPLPTPQSPPPHASERQFDVASVSPEPRTGIAAAADEGRGRRESDSDEARANGQQHNAPVAGTAEPDVDPTEPTVVSTSKGTDLRPALANLVVPMRVASAFPEEGCTPGTRRYVYRGGAAVGRAGNQGHAQPSSQPVRMPSPQAGGAAAGGVTVGEVDSATHGDAMEPGGSQLVESTPAATAGGGDAEHQRRLEEEEEDGSLQTGNMSPQTDNVLVRTPLGGRSGSGRVIAVDGGETELARGTSEGPNVPGSGASVGLDLNSTGLPASQDTSIHQRAADAHASVGGVSRLGSGGAMGDGSPHIHRGEEVEVPGREQPTNSSTPRPAIASPEEGGEIESPAAVPASAAMDCSKNMSRGVGPVPFNLEDSAEEANGGTVAFTGLVGNEAAREAVPEIGGPSLSEWAASDRAGVGLDVVAAVNRSSEVAATHELGGTPTQPPSAETTPMAQPGPDPHAGVHHPSMPPAPTSADGLVAPSESPAPLGVAVETENGRRSRQWEQGTPAAAQGVASTSTEGTRTAASVQVQPTGTTGGARASASVPVVQSASGSGAFVSHPGFEMELSTDEQEMLQILRINVSLYEICHQRNLLGKFKQQLAQQRNKWNVLQASRLPETGQPPAVDVSGRAAVAGQVQNQNNAAPQGQETVRRFGLAEVKHAIQQIKTGFENCKAKASLPNRTEKSIYSCLSQIHKLYQHAKQMRTGIGKSLPSAASSEQQRSLTQATHILDVLIAEFRKLAGIEEAAFTVAQQAGGTYAQQVGTLPVSSSQTAAVSSLQQPDALLLQQPGAMQAVGWPVPAPPSSAPPPTSYAFPNAAQGQAAQYTGHLQMGSSGAVGGGVPYGLHSALPSTGTSDPIYQEYLLYREEFIPWLIKKRQDQRRKQQQQQNQMQQDTQHMHQHMHQPRQAPPQPYVVPQHTSYLLNQDTHMQSIQPASNSSPGMQAHQQVARAPSMEWDHHHHQQYQQQQQQATQILGHFNQGIVGQGTVQRPVAEDPSSMVLVSRLLNRRGASLRDSLFNRGQLATAQPTSQPMQLSGTASQATLRQSPTVPQATPGTQHPSQRMGSGSGSLRLPLGITTTQGQLDRCQSSPSPHLIHMLPQPTVVQQQQQQQESLSRDLEHNQIFRSALQQQQQQQYGSRPSVAPQGMLRHSSMPSLQSHSMPLQGQQPQAILPHPQQPPTVQPSQPQPELVLHPQHPTVSQSQPQLVVCPQPQATARTQEHPQRQVVLQPQHQSASQAQQLTVLHQHQQPIPQPQTAPYSQPQPDPHPRHNSVSQPHQQPQSQPVPQSQPQPVTRPQQHTFPQAEPIPRLHPSPAPEPQPQRVPHQQSQPQAQLRPQPQVVINANQGIHRQAVDSGVQSGRQAAPEPVPEHMLSPVEIAMMEASPSPAPPPSAQRNEHAPGRSGDAVTEGTAANVPGDGQQVLANTTLPHPVMVDSSVAAPQRVTPPASSSTPSAAAIGLQMIQDYLTSIPARATTAATAASTRHTAPTCSEAGPARRDRGGTSGLPVTRTAPPSTGATTTSMLTNRLRKILSELTLDDKERVFRLPVDRAYAPNYDDVIKKPICLKDIREKLEKGQYERVDAATGKLDVASTVAAFRSDLELMVNNCLTYNPPSNSFHKLGKRMGDNIAKRLRGLPSCQ